MKSIGVMHIHILLLTGFLNIKRWTHK